MEAPKSPKRRTLLQRGLLLLAAALGLGAVERKVRGEAAAGPSPTGGGPTSTSATLRLYGRRWQPQVLAHPLGQRSASDHVVGYGDLLNAPHGIRVGEFCTNGFCPETPFGHPFPTGSSIEFQTLKLKEGTLFAMGAAGPEVGAEKTYAILGGTGRFAGARGSYVARTTSVEPAGRSAVEFTLTLTT